MDQPMPANEPNKYRALKDIENSPDLIHWILSGGQEPKLPEPKFALRDPSCTDTIVDLYGGYCNG
jgi:hypothetical protein